jgi:ribosome-associated protein
LLEAKDKALLVAKALSAKKGQDIVILNLQGLTLVADYFVLATGKSGIQVQSLADNVLEELAKAGLKELRVEGLREARWVLVDYGDVVVHIFQEEDRRFYDLERLWGDAKRIEYGEETAEI